MEPVAERVADHLVSHHFGVPCAGQTEQTVGSTGGLVHRVHLPKMARASRRGPAQTRSRLSESSRFMRFVRGLELLALLIGEGQIEGGHSIVDVVRLGCTNDGSGHGRMVGHPGQRYLGPGYLPLSSYSSDLLNDGPITRSIEGAPELVGLAAAGLLVPVPGQPPAAQRAPWNDTHAQVG